MPELGWFLIGTFVGFCLATILYGMLVMTRLENDE